MKNIIFRWLFKKELQEVEKQHDAEMRKLSYELDKQLLEVNRLKPFIEIPKRAFSFFPGSEIIDIRQNRNKEEVFVLRFLKDSFLTIYLFGESYMAINGLPRLMAKIDTDYQTKDKHAKILDIQTVNINVGNGSILMEHFLQSAKVLGVKSVGGWLSEVDAGHFDRSEHFYKKFDFQVTFNNHRTDGSVRLEFKRER